MNRIASSSFFDSGSVVMGIVSIRSVWKCMPQSQDFFWWFEALPRCGPLSRSRLMDPGPVGRMTARWSTERIDACWAEGEYDKVDAAISELRQMLRGNLLMAHDRESAAPFALG